MNYPAMLLLVFSATSCLAQSPEQAAARYFAALAKSDKAALSSIVFEPSANRIGKSIIAAAPMFRRKGDSEFFEMIFDRVPEPSEIAAMTPMEAFTEYMCDPLPDDPADIAQRKVLGVVYERDDLAHVVYRVDGLPNLGETHRDLVTCINRDSEWRVVVSFRVWQAYMNHLLRPAMARLSDGGAESSHAAEPAVQPHSEGESPASAR